MRTHWVLCMVLTKIVRKWATWVGGRTKYLDTQAFVLFTWNPIYFPSYSSKCYWFNFLYVWMQWPGIRPTLATETQQIIKMHTKYVIVWLKLYNLSYFYHLNLNINVFVTFTHSILTTFNKIFIRILWLRITFYWFLKSEKNVDQSGNWSVFNQQWPILYENKSECSIFDT